jgi:hypothetical protein
MYMQKLPPLAQYGPFKIAGIHHNAWFRYDVQPIIYFFHFPPLRDTTKKKGRIPLFCRENIGSAAWIYYSRNISTVSTCR